MSAEDNKNEDNLVGHEYDGIQEFDNDLPPWWKNLFVISIIYSCIYFAGYQMFGWYDQPLQEYENELEYWDKKISAMEASKGGSKPLDPKVEIAEGKAIYEKNCSACHGLDGGGTLGPNLTDKYWIYGGRVEDVTKTVEKGAPSNKGMQAWESQLGKSGVRKVVSYVLSLQGTTPVSPKEKEGSFYDPSGVVNLNVALTDASSLQMGLELYDQYCSACHATDLSGSFAKSLLDDVWKTGSGSFADISKAIKEGDISAKMPAWGSFLDEEQIQKITSYLVDQRNKNK